MSFTSTDLPTPNTTEAMYTERNLDRLAQCVHPAQELLALYESGAISLGHAVNEADDALWEYAGNVENVTETSENDTDLPMGCLWVKDGEKYNKLLTAMANAFHNSLKANERLVAIMRHAYGEDWRGELDSFVESALDFTTDKICEYLLETHFPANTSWM